MLVLTSGPPPRLGLPHCIIGATLQRRHVRHRPPLRRHAVRKHAQSVRLLLRRGIRDNPRDMLEQDIVRHHPPADLERLGEVVGLVPHPLGQPRAHRVRGDPVGPVLADPEALQ